MDLNLTKIHTFGMWPKAIGANSEVLKVLDPTFHPALLNC